MDAPTPPIIEEESNGVESHSKFKLPTFDYMTYAIMAVIALLASFGVNYFVGNTFEIDKKIVEQATAINTINAEIRSYKDMVVTAVDKIPKTIDEEVSISLASLSNKVDNLLSAVDEAKNNSLTASNQASSAVSKATTASDSITSINTQVSSIKADISALQDDIESLQNSDSNVSLATLQNSINSISSKVTALESQVVTLNNQYVLMAININTVALTYSIPNNAIVVIPVSITNTSDSNVNVPIKLVLTTSGTVTVSSIVSLNSTSFNISGTTVTIYYNMYVGANSSVTNNVPVKITYTGTSPNTWTATWSKQ